MKWFFLNHITEILTPQMLSISVSMDYDWVLTSNGAPDMRKAKNRGNVNDMVINLDKKYKAAVKENLALKGKTNDECSICMEKMEGGVALMKCGHVMCISCFAQQARVNNTCPFCRVGRSLFSLRRRRFQRKKKKL